MKHPSITKILAAFIFLGLSASMNYAQTASPVSRMNLPDFPYKQGWLGAQRNPGLEILDGGNRSSGGTGGDRRGVLIVPSLVYFSGFNHKMVQGTSLAVLLPPSGAFTFCETQPRTAKFRPMATPLSAGQSDDTLPLPHTSDSKSIA
jgi:uncharacterized membrane protein YfcA